MILKAFNIKEDVWEDIRLRAFNDRVTCSEIIRRAVNSYLEDKNV